MLKRAGEVLRPFSILNAAAHDGAFRGAVKYRRATGGPEQCHPLPGDDFVCS